VTDAPDNRPIILGGGVAGITAAVELARAGMRPLLVESRPYLGGRMRSFIHTATGDEIDNGQHLLMGCYHATFRLLDLLGTRQLVALQPSLHVEFRDPDGTADILDTPAALPSPLNVLAGMMRLRRLSIAERATLLRVGLAVRRGYAGPRETVRDYLTRLGQSQRVQERLWDPMIIATLNTAPAEASAQLFVEIMRRAFLGKGTASHLGFARHGLSRLIEPAAGYITSAGGAVQTGTTILRIDRDERGYRIHLKDREPITTRQIIAALPSRALHSLVSHDSQLLTGLGIQTLPSSPIVSLYLWFDQPLDSVPPFCALLGTSVQWLFNRRRIAAETNDRFPGLLSCTISAATAEAQTSADAMIAIAERELRAAIPELGSARLLEGLVIKEKEATFLASPASEALRPATRTALPGFYLAGDWTATGLPATIEGAVQSGFEATAQLLGAGRW
jgi:squalene-associated FAD-dependent desaturase